MERIQTRRLLGLFLGGRLSVGAGGGCWLRCFGRLADSIGQHFLNVLYGTKKNNHAQNRQGDDRLNRRVQPLLTFLTETHYRTSCLNC